MRLLWEMKAGIAADRERLFVVIAFRRPPERLMMIPSEKSKSWFKRATGYHAAQIALELIAAKIPGTIKPTDRFLAGTPNYVPFRRRDDHADENPLTMAGWMRRHAAILNSRGSGQSAPRTAAGSSGQPVPHQPRAPGSASRAHARVRTHSGKGQEQNPDVLGSGSELTGELFSSTSAPVGVKAGRRHLPKGGSAPRSSVPWRGAPASSNQAIAPIANLPTGGGA